MGQQRGIFRSSWITALLLMVLAVLMAACGIAPGQNGESEEADEASQGDTFSGGGGGGIVSATGEVVPDDYASLSFEIGGQVVVLDIKEGDAVQEGDLIASLETRTLEAAVAQAEAGVAVSEAALEEAKAGPREEDIAAAGAAVAAANARIAAAQQRRDQLFTEITDDELLAAADELERARMALEDANEAMGTLIYNYENAFDPNDWDPGTDEVNPLSAGETLAESIRLAELNYQLAEAQFEDLEDGPDLDRVRIEEARIAAAAAERDASAARLALLQAQPFEDQIAIREAELEEAKAGLTEAEAALSQAQIFAPFSGTISSLFIDQGEFIAPGQAVLEIGDLSALLVETTDLNEIDVAQISVGSSAEVTFDALPDVIQGSVSKIAPKAEEGTGVNYTVTIELDEIPDNLRWGMTAFVDIDADN